MMNIRAIYEKRALRNTSNMIGLAFIVSPSMIILLIIYIAQFILLETGVLSY